MYVCIYMLVCSVIFILIIFSTVQESSRYEDGNEIFGFGQGICVSYSLFLHLSCSSGVFLAELQIFIIILCFFLIELQIFIVILCLFLIENLWFLLWLEWQEHWRNDLKLCSLELIMIFIWKVSINWVVFRYHVTSYFLNELHCNNSRPGQWGYNVTAVTYSYL